MDEYLILNNGTKVPDAHCLEDGVNLFVYITGEADLMDILQLFSNPKATAVIRASRFGEEAVYTGYTQLYSMSREFGNINLVLRKGENEP